MKGDLSRGFKFLRQQWKTGIVLSSQVILPNQFNHVNFVTIAITPHQSYLINFYLLSLRKLKDHEKKKKNEKKKHVKSKQNCWLLNYFPQQLTLLRRARERNTCYSVFILTSVQWHVKKKTNLICQMTIC